MDTTEPDNDWEVIKGVLGKNVYSQLFKQTLLTEFTVTMTLGLGEAMNKKFSFTGLKITLGEYGRVS